MLFPEKYKEILLKCVNECNLVVQKAMGNIRYDDLVISAKDCIRYCKDALNNPDDPKLIWCCGIASQHCADLCAKQNDKKFESCLNACRKCEEVSFSYCLDLVCDDTGLSYTHL